MKQFACFSGRVIGLWMILPAFVFFVGCGGGQGPAMDTGSDSIAADVATDHGGQIDSGTSDDLAHPDDARLDTYDVDDRDDESPGADSLVDPDSGNQDVDVIQIDTAADESSDPGVQPGDAQDDFIDVPVDVPHDTGDQPCITSTPCVDVQDCENGFRCNTKLSPPRCQKLYCGDFDTPCSDDFLCVSNRCKLDKCTADCTGLECGPDPAYGISCGKCESGATCQSGACVCEPRHHSDCIDDDLFWFNSCGEAGVMKQDCPFVCVNGACAGCDAVGKVDCSGVCTILGSNSNCSDCGDACGSTESCESGICTPVPDEGLVPAGKFWMGCSENDWYCDSDEYPIHEVNLSAFYIDRSEVTVSKYGECVTAAKCTKPATTWSECSWNRQGKADSPVTCVTWDQAVQYCSWRSKRLCTEAEWEKAARGVDAAIYPWGDTEATCDYAVMHDWDLSDDGCGTDDTWDVCGKSPIGDSPYGACDMAGNVNEWVSDWYAEGYYDVSPASNPQGPATGSSHVIRGGSYINPHKPLRASSRSWYLTVLDREATALGFRCCRDAD